MQLRIIGWDSIAILSKRRSECLYRVRHAWFMAQVRKPLFRLVYALNMKYIHIYIVQNYKKHMQTVRLRGPLPDCWGPVIRTSPPLLALGLRLIWIPLFPIQVFKWWQRKAAIHSTVFYRQTWNIVVFKHSDDLTYVSHWYYQFCLCYMSARSGTGQI